MSANKHFTKYWLSCIVMFVLLIFNSCGRSSITVEDLKADIEKEIPIGSNSGQVIDFLNSRKFTNSGYLNTKEYSLEKSDYIKKNRIYASISNVERKFVVQYGIYMVFNFDENGRLIAYSVEKKSDSM